MPLLTALTTMQQPWWRREVKTQAIYFCTLCIMIVRDIEHWVSSSDGDRVVNREDIQGSDLLALSQEPYHVWNRYQSVTKLEQTQGLLKQEKVFHKI